jgi:hypothetical protein
MEAAMSRTTRITKALSVAALTACLAGCDKEQPPSGEPSASGTASTPASTAEPPTPRATTPTASASAPKPSFPCPFGSTGEGTFKSPCEAKGPARLMDVQWTGKTDDKGPSFRVTNNAKLAILYGNVVVYFYDKAGKQLEVPATGSAKARPKQTCSGNNLFAGAMKPGEKAVLTFSCVKKEHVPDGTAVIEAEMQMVGFTDEIGVKADTFWRNNEIVPDTRPKGGVK